MFCLDGKKRLTPLCVCVYVWVYVNFPECLHVWGGCGLPRWPSGKESAVDADSIPGPGRPSGGGHGDPLQCSCLGKSLERGTWWARIYRVAQSRTRLKELSTQHAWACASVCVCVCAHVRACMSESTYACGCVFLVVHRCAHMWRERKEEIYVV